MQRGMDWYKREPIAFLDAVQGIGPELIGAYAVLLDLIYARGGQTQRDDRHLAGVLGCSMRKAKSLTEQLLDRGKIQFHDGFITNSRAKREAKQRRDSTETKAAQGRKGGENGVGDSKNRYLDQANQGTKRKQNREDKSREDNISIKKNITKKDFDIFWELYPKKVNKKKASEVYSSKIKASKDPDQLHGKIAEGLRHYIDCKPDYQDWMHPTTFLNGERWNDRYPEPQRQGGPHGQQSHNSEPSVSAGMAEAVARLTGEQRTPDQTAHTGPTIDLERDRSTGEGSGNANYH